LTSYTAQHLEETGGGFIIDMGTGGSLAIDKNGSVAKPNFTSAGNTFEA